MNNIILSNKNKLKISVIMLSTIIFSCLFMIFNDNKDNDENILLADTYDTKDYSYTVVKDG